MTKTYLVKLNPLDYYYFGGEETFDLGAKGIRNYLVKSNILPQQTALVGLIRHALYGKYDIGNSFNSPDGFNIGVLKSLSPVFIVNAENEFIFPHPANINAAGMPITVSFSNLVTSFVNGKWQANAPETALYDAKQGLGHYWINSKTEHIVSKDKIFRKTMHIGIDKRKRLQDNNDLNAFYKQEFVSLLNGCMFGFILELDEQVKIEHIPKLMSLGGEKRTFHVSVEACKSNWQILKEEVASLMKKSLGAHTGFVLLADTYVEQIDQLYPLVNYAFMDEQPFRNIITPKTVTDFARLTKDSKQPNTLIKNSRVNSMIKRGAVLFADAGNKAAIEALLKNGPYEAIGYNQYSSNI
jgi:CRISPR-associated protein Cmr3